MNERQMRKWSTEQLEVILVNQQMRPSPSGEAMARLAEAELDYRHRKDIRHWITYDD